MNTEVTSHDVSMHHEERYLLGDLDEREIERLERGLLEEPARLEQLEAAEAELIDRYVRGELPSGDRNRFERRLLPSARIRERVRTARSLRRLAEQTNADRTPRASETASGRVLPIDSRGTNGNGGGAPVSSRLAWAACLVVLLATGFLALLNLRLQDRLDRTQRAHRQAVEKALSAEGQVEEMAQAADQAEVRRADLERLRNQVTEREERIDALESRIEQATSTRESDGKTGAVEQTSLFLALATRGSGPEELQLPLDGDELLLELGLGRKQLEGELTVTVRRQGFPVPVWRDSGLEPVYFGPEGMVPVTLPKQILFPGTYDIEVIESSKAAETRIASYNLLIKPE